MWGRGWQEKHGGGQYAGAAAQRAHAAHPNCTSKQHIQCSEVANPQASAHPVAVSGELRELPSYALFAFCPSDTPTTCYSSSNQLHCLPGSRLE